MRVEKEITEIRITAISVKLQDNGSWRAIVQLGNTGTIEITRPTPEAALAFCQYHIDRERENSQ